MNEEQKVPILPRFLPKNPLLQGMPEHLKDPANFKKIYKAIYNAGVSMCDHAEVIEWAGCKKCQSKAWARKETMKKLGFRSGSQYLLWCRIHEQIKERVPLPKYNT